MPWRVYCTGLALLLLAVAFLLTDVLLWEPGVTERNVRRIRYGMTLEEVEAGFGRPADMSLVLPLAGRDWSCSLWDSDRGEAEVRFDARGRVTVAQFYPQ